MDPYKLENPTHLIFLVLTTPSSVLLISKYLKSLKSLPCVLSLPVAMNKSKIIVSKCISLMIEATKLFNRMAKQKNNIMLFKSWEGREPFAA